MLPEHIAIVLQQLSYIVIIICGPVIVWLTIKSIILDLKLQNHIDQNTTAHAIMSHHLGRHDSQINDLQMDAAEASGRLKL